MFEVWNWLKTHKQACAWIVAIFVGGYLFQQVHHEAQIREDQFCGVVIGEYKENVRSYRETQKFLKSPEGRENTGINKAIRTNKDLVLIELKAERKRIPAVCYE